MKRIWLLFILLFLMPGSNAPAQNASGAWSGNPGVVVGVAPFRPNDAYDVGSNTDFESRAWDGEVGAGYQAIVNNDANGLVYFGRDSGNNDKWDAEPSFTGDISVYVQAYRPAATSTERYGLSVQESDGTPVGVFFATTSNYAKGSPGPYEVVVTGYAGDIADLRVVGEVSGADSTATEMLIDEVWVDDSPFRPTDFYDPGSVTISDAKALTKIWGLNESGYTIDGGNNGLTYWGRNSSNVDQWTSEPSYAGSVYMYVRAQRDTSLGIERFELRIEEADSTEVAVLIDGATSNQITATTFSTDITSYKGDIADLRVVAEITNAQNGFQGMNTHSIWVDE